MERWRSVTSLPVILWVAFCLGNLFGAEEMETVLFDFEGGFDVHSVEADRVNASLVGDGADHRLRLEIAAAGAYPSAVLRAPRGYWDLSSRRYLKWDLSNPGPQAVSVSCWAFAPGGWGGVGSYPLAKPRGWYTLPAGARVTAEIDLHQRFPGGITKQTDPSHVTLLHTVLMGQVGARVEVGGIRATGEGLAADDESLRLRVPDMTDDAPAAGRRVKQRLAEYQATEVFHALYLPADWRPGGRYPVIVEYPGNIFYDAYCYSTGRTEYSTMGYGMSRDVGCIWLNLPFISTDHKRNEVDGWGDADATADYCIKAVKDVCERYGGDPGAVILTGFSRGGIACGYIGLRNDAIADVWLAFHPNQGFDGQDWHGSTPAGARERAARIKGRAVFVTDSGWGEKVLGPNGIAYEAGSAKLGAHADTAFLEDRPVTRECRAWLARVLRERPGARRGINFTTNGEAK